MRADGDARVLRDLDRLFRQGIAPQGDRALLERFAADRDESAFEALVGRHGPMVLGVCRRMLADRHEADDAFQATFLVLIRRAGQVRDPDRLGPWLFGVASRVAGKARARALAARRRHGGPAEDAPAPAGPASAEWSDVGPILDDELGRLPGRLREVLVLCLLEGATAEEAARRLACPVGTVKSRLARGREALRGRLVGRGLAPGLATLAAASALSPPVSAALNRSTLRLLGSAHGGLVPGVAALAEGVTPAMIAKPTLVAALALGGLALAGLGGLALSRTPAIAQAPLPPAVRPAAPAAQAAVNRSRDNLKVLGLAFLNHAEAHGGRFPPPAILGPDGQPLLSWRVAMLPYLGEGRLFDEFRLDEPWDSPHNEALIPRMPAVFRTPHAPAPDGQTRFRVFEGRGSMFDAAEGVGIADITDGNSNTVLAAVAAEPTTWTRPGDLPFDADGPPPPLDDTGGAYFIGLADGSALSLKNRHPAFLRALITRNGAEAFDWSARDRDIPPEPVGPPARLDPPNSAPPPTIEQRLEALESKVDLILKKLESLPGSPAGP